METTLKAYQCSESEYYAAESAEQAKELYQDDCGDTCEEGFPRELDDSELDQEVPEFDENECQTGGVTSVRAFLAEASPGWLCTTQW